MNMTCGAMGEIDFISIDVFILTVVILSFIIGWVRGATREILSVVSWIGGICLAVALFPHAKEFTRGYISHKLIADFVTACGLFILFLTLLSIFNYFCSNMVKKSVLNVTDKALGGVFGIVRGVVILAVLELVINQCLFTETPKCVEESKLRPTIASISKFLVLVLPEDLQNKILSQMTQIKKQSLLDFVKTDVIEKIAPNADLGNLEDAQNAPVVAESAKELEKKAQEGNMQENEQAQATSSQTQSAEELATLKPKRITVEKGKNITQKGRNDMDRILDQFDDVEE